MSEGRGIPLIGIILALAVTAATKPDGLLPNAANQRRPPITEQEQRNPSESRDAKNNADHPFFVAANCEHGCGYSEDNKGWWQKLWTDPTASFTGLLFLSTGLLWWVTERTLSHAERASNRQLRAYVSGRPTVITYYVETGMLIVSCDCKNHGQTPAKNMRVAGYVDAGPWPMQTMPNLPPFSDAPGATPVVIFPDAVFGSHTTANRVFTETEMDALAVSSTGRLYIFAVIKYDDWFGGGRETHFCASIPGRFLTVAKELAQQERQAGRAGIGKAAIEFEFAGVFNDAT